MTAADDLASISAVIHRYGAALDAADTAGVLACFTDDVRLEFFHGATVADGIEQAREFFRFDGQAALPGLDKLLSTTHLWNVGAVEVHDDHATAATSCVSYLLGLAGSEAVLVTRGLRYVDELRRTPSGWLIGHRRHLPQWETRVPATVLSANESS